jgi:DNA-directed RNA polymerase III subunit RPC7
MPDTGYPSEREASIAKRYNAMMSEMKFGPYWIDAPTRASTGTFTVLPTLP